MARDLELLQEVGTAAISDTFDVLGITPPVLDNSIRAIAGTFGRFAGPAYTITGRTHTWKGGGDRDKLQAIDEIHEGAVPIWAGTDIEGVCCFGDLLATAMKARGAVGVVVDGGVRDSSFLMKLGLPVTARYVTPAQAIGRWHVSGWQIPIFIRGALEKWVRVNPGDTIVSDEDGIIVIPSASLSNVVDLVSEWTSKDSAVREEISQGLRLIDALEKYGPL